MHVIENPFNRTMPMHYLAFNVNNHGILYMNQTQGVNHEVKVYTATPGDLEGRADQNRVTVSPGDMVMLMNYYRYIKRNNIHCQFINPNGEVLPKAQEKRYTVTIADYSDPDCQPWTTVFTSRKRAEAFMQAAKDKLAQYDGADAVTVTLDAGLEDDEMYLDWIEERYGE